MARKYKPIQARLLIAALCVIAVIIHGSLYPYAFHPNGGLATALKMLLDSWSAPPAGFSDLVANLFLYMPLGFSGVLAFRIRHRLALITFCGFLLSVFIETAQFFDAGRVTNMSDVYLNTAGTFLGGLAGIVFDLRLRNRAARISAVQPIPVILLSALLVYRFYPYVPTIDVHKYWHSIKPLLHPMFSVLAIFQSFALWLTTYYLLRAAFPRTSPLTIVWFVLFVFAAKIAIVGLALSASELCGAALALCLWLLLLERSHFSAGVTFVVLGAMVLLLRLQPFDFQAGPAAPFGWVPFRSIVQGDLQNGFIASGEKFFLYGSLIWIGGRAGLNLWLSTCAVAVLLLLTSVAETHIPGRSAEITDCVMALLIGGGFAALRDSRRGRRSDANGHSFAEARNRVA